MLSLSFLVEYNRVVRKGYLMRIAKFFFVIAVASMVIWSSGCISEQEHQGLKDQNRIQADTIDELRREVGEATIELNQLRNKLEILQGRNSASGSAKDAEIAALEADIAAKKALIERLQAAMLKDTPKLPVRLNMALRDFAANNDTITFDEETGVLKFESDFLFKSGSDKVQPGAVDAVKMLGTILTSSDGEKFHVVVAGHTDNDPIKYSKALHPTNWHLSVHRAIAVLNMLATNNVSKERLSVRGFGEFRPITANESKVGKASNRRVEIFIIPAGA